MFRGVGTITGKSRAALILGRSCRVTGIYRRSVRTRTVVAVTAAIACVVVLSVVVAIVAAVRGSVDATANVQGALDPFYTASSPLPPGAPGDIIRSEPLTPDPGLTNARSYRVLYRTEMPDGTPRVSGAMLFIPTAPAPVGGRKVIAWAHPTVGMGDSCAPSRSSQPTQNMDWLQGMLDRGWVVTATDYAGLGTVGIEYYLIGQNEAIDTINSVRMARQFPGADASDTYGAFGHSQGGHAALWAGAIAPSYAPELHLVGVAGAAPAAAPSSLVSQQWADTVSWVIGPDVFTSFPAAYPDLDLAQVASPEALKRYESIAGGCMLQAMIEGRILQHLGKTAFTVNPMTVPAWAKALTAQTAKPLPASMPILITESVNDAVVIPSTIALLQETWCAAGSTLQVDWLGPLRGTAGTPSSMTHIYEGAVGGALATTWFDQRFTGTAPASNCGTPPLVEPAPMP